MATADSLNIVLDRYDLGGVRTVTAAGGTAGKTWKIEAGRGTFLLRMRGVRTSGDARLQFDHGLRRRLAERGVPTAEAVPTTGGQLWVRHDGRVFELYSFVAGRAFNPESLGEIAAAGRALADYHLAARDYRPPQYESEPIAQYTTLGFSDRVSDRMDDPALQRMNMEAVRGLATRDDERRLIDQCTTRVKRLEEVYAGEAFCRLTGWVIHGDYTPANLLFSEDGHVAGIFDLDWAAPGARCRDVADGMYFFATRRRMIESSDIWALTESADFDAERCLVFLNAYTSVSKLSAEEIEAIPSAFAGRWFSIRLEGMPKVPPEDRLRFFARGVLEPLEWLDDNWGQLRRQLT